MTAVKDSNLYKTLKKAVRKEDHAELLRMLEMVPYSSRYCFAWFDSKTLFNAFLWHVTPQGFHYWEKLSRRLKDAGHDCY